MPTEYQIILNTCPDHTSARKIADLLIDQELAACVSILPGVESVYRWQGKIESSQEHLLIIKSSNKHYPALEQAILEAHPYELPEIISVPIEMGLAGYLAWIENNTSK